MKHATSGYTRVKINGGWGFDPLEQRSTPSRKVPRWGWGSVLDNLQLNNIVIFDIPHFPGKYQNTTAPE